MIPVEMSGPPKTGSRIPPVCEHCGQEPNMFARFLISQQEALAEINAVEVSGALAREDAFYVESDYHPVVLAALKLPFSVLFAERRKGGSDSIPMSFFYLENHECWAVRAAYAAHPEAAVDRYSPLLNDEVFAVRSAVWSRAGLTPPVRDILRFEFGEPS